MSDLVVVALIQGGVAVLVVVLNARQSGRLKRVEKATNATKEQVVNGHVDADGNPINMRHENDERHDENAKKLDRILHAVARLEGSLSRVWERLAVQGDQIHDLEMTQPRADVPRQNRKRRT